MSTISVIFHSSYGHTTNQAHAIVDGIGSIAGVAPNLIAIVSEGEITDEDRTTLDESDAIIFGSPTNTGMAS